MPEELEGGSALRFDSGQFFSALQDDYCLPAPSHPPELDRLDYLGEIFKELLGLVPPEAETLLRAKGGRVLDIGCGTGKWAADVAAAFPEVQVLGLDLVDAPIPFPPPNCSFAIHDILRGLPFPDDTFDVVHARDLLPGVHDLAALLRECVRVLKPGGILLLLEIEYEVSFFDRHDFGEVFPLLERYLQHFQNALRERGLDPTYALRLGELAGGLERMQMVTHERRSVPLTPWSQDPTLAYVGQLSSGAFSLFPSAIRIMLLDHGALESDELAAAAQAELASSPDARPVWMFDRVVARKV